MFLGHVSNFTEGTIYPLPQYDKRKSLMVSNGYNLVNNVCPHQGSLILTEPSGQLSCRYHGWGWDANGQPTTSGQSATCNKSKLSIAPVHVNNSLLFTDPIDLSTIKNDLSFMRLVSTRVDQVRSDWRHIVDVFLDVDHIPVVHNSVYDSMGIVDTDVEWSYYSWGSVQRVSKTAQYSNEYKFTLKNLPEEDLAAWWITVYPGTMIEWQPGALFVTQCYDRGETTDVLVTKYRDTRYSDQNWQLNSKIWETAWKQDKQQSEAMAVSFDKVANLEEQKKHFRKWIKSA